MAIVAPRPSDDSEPRGAARSGRPAGREAERADAARPALHVVARRRRWPAVVGGVSLVVVISAMLGAAVFHTQLAERQLTIDDLEQRVRTEQRRFEELRRDRAVLRSPQRIGVAATELGMVQGEASRFEAVDPHELAVQLAAAGAADDDVRRVRLEEDPLDQVRDVKAASAEMP